MLLLLKQRERRRAGQNHRAHSGFLGKQDSVASNVPWSPTAYVRFLTIHLTVTYPLGCSFFIRKMGIIIVHTSEGSCKNAKCSNYTDT